MKDLRIDLGFRSNRRAAIPVVVRRSLDGRAHYRSGIELGKVLAAANFGWLLQQQGDREGAEVAS